MAREYCRAGREGGALGRAASRNCSFWRATSARLGGRAALLRRRGRRSPAECKELIDTAVREFGGTDADLQRGDLDARIFDDVELDAAKLMDVNSRGYGLLPNTHCPTQASKGRSSAFRPSPAARTARPHGLVGFEIRHDGLPRNAAHRNLKKGLHVMIACRDSRPRTSVSRP